MFFKNHGDKQTIKVDVEEAYTLWRALVDRYIAIDHLNLLKNFTHDRDFNVYLVKIVEDIKQEADMLEKLLQKHNIKGPNPNARDRISTGNSEIISDRGTAEILYRLIRLDVNLMALSLKYSPTNDTVWNTIISLLKGAINRVDNFIKYLKIKNWINHPPLYPNNQTKTTEQVAINEIFLLWDHLIFRYHNIRQTQIYTALSADPDFTLFLTTGVKILQKEAKDIEDKLLHYGVAIPKPYSPITLIPENKELIEDKYMFNQILIGMHYAVALHASAIQEIIINDELRKFFIKLTFTEIDYLGKMSKYGKLKNWVFPTPAYKGV